MREGDAVKEVLTVGYFRDKIEDLPDNYEIRAYEGEGGSWIIVERPNDGQEVLAFNTR
jgi:hypothetical protein